VAKKSRARVCGWSLAGVAGSNPTGGMDVMLWVLHKKDQKRSGVSRESAAARLLELWVRIPSGAWMPLVSVVCCQAEVSATGRSLVQRSPTDWGVSLCVIYKPRARDGPGPRWAVAPQTNTSKHAVATPNLRVPQNTWTNAEYPLHICRITKGSSSTKGGGDQKKMAFPL
jgi:hypothetical protein